MTRLLSCTLRLMAWVMAHEDMPISCVGHAHVLNELARRPQVHVLDKYAFLMYHSISSAFSGRYQNGYKPHVVGRLRLAFDMYALLDKLVWHSRLVNTQSRKELWAELRSLANKAAELET